MPSGRRKIRSPGGFATPTDVSAGTTKGTTVAVAVELRIRIHQQLAEIDADVVRPCAIVGEPVAEATDSLVTGVAEVAGGVTGRDVKVERLECDLEQRAERRLLTQSPMCGDMSYFVPVLRMVPKLERRGDLAEYVTQGTVSDLGLPLTMRMPELSAQRGSRCVTMFETGLTAVP
jgi:phosphate uptake regulator